MRKWFLAALTAAALCCALLGTASAYTGVPDYFTQEIQAADNSGIIPDLLKDANLSQNITRREFCHVIVAAYESRSSSGGSGWYDPWEDYSGWYWYFSAPKLTLQKTTQLPDIYWEDDDIVGYYFDDDGDLWFVERDGTEWMYDEDDDWWSDWDDEEDQDDDWWNDRDDEDEKPDTNRPSAYFSDVNDSVIDKAHELGFVNGYEDGTFRPDNLITRQEMFKMMDSLLDKVRYVSDMSLFKASAFLNNYPDGASVADWAKPSTARLLYYGVTNGSGGLVDPSSQSTRAQAIVMANRVLTNDLTPSTLPLKYPIVSDMGFYFNSSGLVSDDWYSWTSHEEYIFDGGPRYATQAETTPHIVSVKVPVWKLKSDGTKYASTATVQVHEKLQHIIWAVFNEIYNDPEQFPIADLGGYSWRGDTSNSEHKWGLAVDINSNANPQIWDGVVRVGTAWNPGVDPYSITPEGSVVRIFAKYGFTWGGDAWGEWNRDYMHFSYLGT